MLLSGLLAADGGWRLAAGGRRWRFRQVRRIGVSDRGPSTHVPMARGGEERSDGKARVLGRQITIELKKMEEERMGKMKYRLTGLVGMSFGTPLPGMADGAPTCI